MGLIFIFFINVFYLNGYLLVFWSKDVFEDLEDLFFLIYEYVFGKKNICFCEYNYFDVKFCME